MEADAVFGFARDEDVANAIIARHEFIVEEGRFEVLKMLREAVIALLEINSVIPVGARHRHLVAQALEAFAEPPTDD